MWISVSLHIVLFLSSLGPINCAHVFLEPLAPLRRQPYMAHCLIGFVDGSEMVNSIDIILSIDNEVRCVVSHYEYYLCNKAIPDVLVDKTCGCSGKFYHARIANESQIYVVVFRLYLFFVQIHEKLNGQRMFCHYNINYNYFKDNKTINVIDYTKRPEPQIFMCKTGNISLTWDFNYTNSPQVLSHYQPRQLIWVGMPYSRHEGLIDVARYIYTTRTSKGKFAIDKMSNVRLITTGVIPQLKLLELESNHSMVIQLNLTFFAPEISYVTTKRNRYDRSADQDEEEEEEDLVEIPDTTTTTTTASTTTTTSASTTPKPISYDPKKVVLSLIDEVMINVTMPPSAGATIAIDNSISFTGNRLLTCLVKEMPFPGTPVVNLTLWKDDKIEMTMPNATKITKMFANEEWVGENISCGLTGKATMCLSANDPRVKPFTKGLKEFVFKIRPPETIDVWLALYACQVSGSMMMMIWTLSLMIRHVGIILKYERRKHEFERYKKYQRVQEINSDMEDAASEKTE